MKYIYILLSTWVLAGTFPLSAARASELVDFSSGGNQETITLNLHDAVPHQVFIVPDPDRLVVDVPPVSGHHELRLPHSYRGRLIRAARFGQFDPDTSRFVFDLTQPVRVAGVREVHVKKEVRLIIDIVPGGPVKTAASPLPVTPPVAEVKPEPRPVQNPAREKAIAKTAQARPRKPVIVIDPGHGGVDPGTIGPDGTQEKDVVLEFAKMLKAKLLKTGRYQVLLTHEDDEFIMLRKRVDIARKAHASLFISLHADSAPEMAARGLSVYTLSEQASDKEAEALAARENKADVLAGMDLSDEREDVAGILISLAQRETKNRSAVLADKLVSRLDERVRLLQNSHRFAGFAVLKAPDIPSVLIETGFLSHPQEEKLLKSKAYRDKVTSGIVAGIDAYFRDQKEAAAQ